MFHDITTYEEIAQVTGKEEEFEDLKRLMNNKWVFLDKKKDRDIHRDRIFKKLKKSTEGDSWCM